MNQGHDILNDGWIFPDVISTAAAEPDFFSRCLDAVVNGRKARIEGHHGRDKHRLYLFMIRDGEHAWPLAAWLEVAEQHAIKVNVFHSPVGAREFELVQHIKFGHVSVYSA